MAKVDRAAWGPHLRAYLGDETDEAPKASPREERLFAAGFATAATIAIPSLEEMAVPWADLANWACHSGLSPGDPSQCPRCRRILAARAALRLLQEGNGT